MNIKPKTTVAMSHAIAAVVEGKPVREAARMHGVTSDGLYKALRLHGVEPPGERCPTCGRITRLPAVSPVGGE